MLTTILLTPVVPGYTSLAMTDHVPRRLLCFAIITFLGTATAFALPPFQDVMEQLERFRSETGNLRAEGSLGYADQRDVAVEMHCSRGTAPLLTTSRSELRADWTDGSLDLVLRLVGAVLGASELAPALEQLGYALEPQLQTLLYLGDDLVYVVGGSQSAPVLRLYVERDTYRLRQVDFPTVDGMLVMHLDDYRLADGWFPSRITVEREQQSLFRLQLDRVSPAHGE
jgi:hypothetical protein